MLTTKVSGTNSTSIWYCSYLIPAFRLCTSRRRGVRILARPISSCLHHHENASGKVRLPTVLDGNHPDLAAPRRGRVGGIALFSGENCTVARLVANPWASQQHDGGRVVEVGVLDHCGNIAKRRPGASGLLEGARSRRLGARPISRVVATGPIQVLEYLTGRIGHLTSGTRSGRYADCQYCRMPQDRCSGEDTAKTAT